MYTLHGQLPEELPDIVAQFKPALRERSLGGSNERMVAAGLCGGGSGDGAGGGGKVAWAPASSVAVAAQKLLVEASAAG